MVHCIPNCIHFYFNIEISDNLDWFPEDSTPDRAESHCTSSQNENVICYYINMTSCALAYFQIHTNLHNAYKTIFLCCIKLSISPLYLLLLLEADTPMHRRICVQVKSTVSSGVQWTSTLARQKHPGSLFSLKGHWGLSFIMTQHFMHFLFISTIPRKSMNLQQFRSI